MGKVLVTGAEGFLGSYMVGLQTQLGNEVTAAHLTSPSPQVRARWGNATPVTLDVTDGAAVSSRLAESRPEVVYHFAGHVYVEPSWESPVDTYRVNVLGTLNLLDTLRRTSPSTTFVFAGSGTEYGEPERTPTPETSELRPTSPYASSKVAADLLCLQYFLSHRIPVFRLRIFGTTGVGKRGDVCNDFASQIAKIERRTSPAVIEVGTLDVRRDIADVRDAVRAMARVAEAGEPGGAYNIGSGRALPVRAILDTLRGLSKVPFEVKVDPRRFRKVDEPIHLADIGRLKGLGWEPKIPIERTLNDILDHWRTAGDD